MMKKLFALVLGVLLLISATAGCKSTQAGPVQSPEASTAPAAPTVSADAGKGEESPAPDVKIAYVTDKLGDNASNDNNFRGVQQFMDETGIKVTVVEASEIQDFQINARSFAQDGYNLVICTSAPSSELIKALAPEYPDTFFVIGEGTVNDQPNVASLRTRVGEAAFLTGAFSVLMSEELSGVRKGAFVGGARNPNLERAQYSYTAACEYLEGEATSVYVGDFTDVAKCKEIGMQLYQDGYRVIQSYAGAAGSGIYQAADTMQDGYYAISTGENQFKLSDKIIAAHEKYMNRTYYNALINFMAGTLEAGEIEVGLSEGSVDIVYAQGAEQLIPQSVKDQVEEIRAMLISGELYAPTTEEEYNAFKAEFVK